MIEVNNDAVLEGLSYDSLMSMSIEEREAFICKAFGVKGLLDINIPEIIMNTLKGIHTDDKSWALGEAMLKSSPIALALATMLVNGFKVCEVVDDNGNHLATRFFSHMGRVHILFDDSTAQFVKFNSNSFDYIFNPKTGVFKLISKKSGEVFEFTPNRLLTDADFKDPMTVRSSAEHPAIILSYIPFGEDDFKGSKPRTSINYASLIWGLSRDITCLLGCRILGFKLYDMHHKEFFSSEWFNYCVNDSAHPDRVENIQLMSTEQHIALHKEEAKKRKEEKEAARLKEIEIQRRKNCLALGIAV